MCDLACCSFWPGCLFQSLLKFVYVAVYMYIYYLLKSNAYKKSSKLLV